MLVSCFLLWRPVTDVARLEAKDRREEQGYAPRHRTDGVTHPTPPAREQGG